MNIAGIVIVIGTLVIAAFPSLFAASDPIHIDLHLKFFPPTLAHPFGTDEVGRDILSRAIYGFRIDLTAGVVVVALASLIGIPFGLISGYRGGWVDEVIMRTTDIFLAMPAILLALGVNAALGPALINSMIAIGFAWWPIYTRLVRGQTLVVREQLYVEASKSLGASGPHVLFRDILPNVTFVIIIQMTMQVGFAILLTGALGFLGLGAQPPTPEWGTMMAEGRNFLPDYWWTIAFPGLMMFITVLGFALLGDGLRDIFDPRMRRVIQK